MRRRPGARTPGVPLMPSDRPSSVAHVAELVARTTRSRRLANRAADELLVLERPVHVGGVEEVDAELERAVDRGDRLGVVASAVELAHAHAAESHRRYREPGCPNVRFCYGSVSHPKK